MSTAAGSDDPYTVRHQGFADAPASFAQRLRYLGPSVVVAGSIVGSGELILTSGLGAAAGFALLWWVLLSCWVKSLTQAELARYIIVSGDTYIRAMNRLPGKIPGPRGPVSFPIALALLALVPGLMGLGGILGGAGQALGLLVPALPSTWATAAIAIAAALLLLSGSYAVLERTMIALVVGFAAATLVCAIWMQFTEYRMTGADLATGFAFDFPAEHLVAALAVYGYTGVNASETSAYTYWCVEKGYPNFIGSPQIPGWEARARAWIKVLHTDVWLTLLILTAATVPFYVLGAGVLRPQGVQPSGLGTIATLSEMFTKTLGPWALWLFGIGAFLILFSTTISALAAGARYIPDYIVELGYMERANLRARVAWIRGYCGVMPLVALALYLAFQNPVFLVTVSALTLALMLPIQSAAVLWLQRQRLDPRVRPGRCVRLAIAAIFVFQSGMAGLVIWYVVL